MKRLFYLVFGVILLSCTPKVVVNDNVFYGNSMYRSMNGKYSIAQFDSMCVADTLPNDLSKWMVLYLKEYETGEKVSLHAIYKKNVVYRVEDTKDDSVKITKRIVK